MKALVNVRLGSSRLPGKVLKSLWNGKTALEILIERLSASTEIDEIIINTRWKIIQKNKSIFKSEPKLLFLPDVHQPTSFYLTKNFFISKKTLLSSIFKLVGKKFNINEVKEDKFHDIIDDQKIFKI